jgi:membrane protein DedA with SNARE-associated domain
MHHSLFHVLHHFVAQYGYWAVAAALLVESIGIPVPGEVTLLLASFVAYSERQLHLGWIIVFGTVAAALGSTAGYAVGYYGGRPLLERYQSIFRIQKSTLERGEQVFARYGAVAVFLARFIFGIRIFAGPIAGVLRLRWRTFTIYNFLGAAVWVAVVSSCGFLFGQHWHELLHALQRFNLVLGLLGVAAIIYFWWRKRQLANSAS